MILRWLNQKILNRDYVSFKFKDNCKVTIKSCVLLTATQIAHILIAIDKSGYKSKKQRHALLINIGLALSEQQLLNSTCTNVSCQYISKKGKEHVYLSIVEE